MLIVDGQIHIWAANTPDRPCPQTENRIETHHSVGKNC